MRKHFIPHRFSNLLVSETIQRVWGMTHWKSVIEWRREGRWILIACRKIVCYVVWTPFCKILWIMFQTSGSPMPSIASPPSSQSQFCPWYSQWPSIRHLLSWNSSTAHRGDGCEEDFHTLCDRCVPVRWGFLTSVWTAAHPECEAGARRCGTSICLWSRPSSWGWSVVQSALSSLYADTCSLNHTGWIESS